MLFYQYGFYFEMKQEYHEAVLQYNKAMAMTKGNYIYTICIYVDIFIKNISHNHNTKHNIQLNFYLFILYKIKTK